MPMRLATLSVVLLLASGAAAPAQGLCDQIAASCERMMGGVTATMCYHNAQTCYAQEAQRLSGQMPGLAPQPSRQPSPEEQARMMEEMRRMFCANERMNQWTFQSVGLAPLPTSPQCAGMD